jgi:Domain of unknown function (DUF4349)
MTSDEILFELRTLPGAPDVLRERVRALPVPAARREWTLPRIEWRRTALVLAPAAVALAFGAAAVHGLFAGGETSATRTTVQAGRTSHGGGAGATWDATKGARQRALAPGQTAQSLEKLAQPKAVPAAPAPSATRLNRYEAWLRVQVDRESLSKAATQAMQIARGYGGYVASVDLNTPGKRGRASLVLRVPVTKVQDAVLRLGRLGDVSAQHVRIRDLQRQFDAQQRALIELRDDIAALERALKNPALPGDRRLLLKLQLAKRKRALTQLTGVHDRTAREGRLATISVGLFVPGAAAVAPAHEGRLERTLRDAGGFLVTELAWLLYAVIVAAPVALVVALALLGARAVRRGSDRRLLESA